MCDPGLVPTRTLWRVLVPVMLVIIAIGAIAGLVVRAGASTAAVARGTAAAGPAADDGTGAGAQAAPEVAAEAAVDDAIRTPIRAVFLGDSITVGNSDLANGVLSPQSWFYGLVDEETDPMVYAGGVAENGRNTGWMAEHVDEALALDPQLLVVLGGTNDIGAGLPAEETMANLRTIKAAADSAGVRMAVSTIPPLSDSDLGGRVDLVNATIRVFAAESGALLLDTTTVLSDGQGGWRPGLTTDGIHPNEEGARLMAEAAAASLSTLE